MSLPVGRRIQGVHVDSFWSCAHDEYVSLMAELVQEAT